MPKYQFGKTDFANMASKLPRPLQRPAGAIGGFLEQLLGLNNPMSMMTAQPEITLLPKGQILNNLLNHVKDAEGTPLEAAMNAAAEKAPHVLGHISKVEMEHLSPPGQLGFGYGIFRGDPAHLAAPGGVLKGREIGSISLDPVAHEMSIPPADIAETLGHEMTHGAQAMMKNPAKWDRLYKLAEDLYGYADNPFEQGANRAGHNLSQLTREMLMQEMKKRSSK